jgi:hypothetical protein
MSKGKIWLEFEADPTRDWGRFVENGAVVSGPGTNNIVGRPERLELGCDGEPDMLLVVPSDGFPPGQYRACLSGVVTKRDSDMDSIRRWQVRSLEIIPHAGGRVGEDSPVFIWPQEQRCCNGSNG